MAKYKWISKTDIAWSNCDCSLDNNSSSVINTHLSIISAKHFSNLRVWNLHSQMSAVTWSINQKFELIMMNPLTVVLDQFCSWQILIEETNVYTWFLSSSLPNKFQCWPLLNPICYRKVIRATKTGGIQSEDHNKSMLLNVTFNYELFTERSSSNIS